MPLKESIRRAVRGLLQQASTRSLNIRFVYMNILRELGRTAEAVATLEDLRRVKYVGEKTFRSIADAMERGGCAASPGARPAARRHRVELDEALDISSTDGMGDDPDFYLDAAPVERADAERALSDRLSSSCTIAAPVEAEAGVRRRAGRRGYIPAYRSAPYAVLRALSELGGAHKYLVAMRAAPFTDAEFSRTARFSAFSAFKALESRGLICLESGSRYVLTADGRALCRVLFAAGARAAAEQPAAEEGIRLVIDSRERRGPRERGFFQAYFAERRIESVTRHLGLGDFLWLRGETVLDYIVERKGGGDFASSIADGRYREQKRRLRMLGVRAFYLVENLRLSDANAGLCRYCLTETKMDGFTVVETEDINESADVLCMLDRRVRSGDFCEVMSYGSFIEEGARQVDAYTVLLSALLGIRGLGRERAAALADRFGTMGGYHAAAGRPGFEEELGRAAGGRGMARRIMRMLE